MSEEAAPQEQDSVDPFAVFSDRVRTPVEGLVYLGQIQETVEFCGHTFELRTLQPQHRFAISVAVQPYRDTLSEADAYQAAHVAMAVVTVDGQDYCPPIGPNLNSHVEARLKYVGKNWYGPTIAFLWSEYIKLEQKAVEAIQELDRLSKGSQPMNLPPWLDSLIEQGRSSEQTNSDTQPSAEHNSD